MKKFLCLLAAFTLIFTFTACSQNSFKGSQQKPKGAQENVEQSQQNEDLQNQEQQKKDDSSVNKIKYNLAEDYLGEISVFLGFDSDFSCNHNTMDSFDEVLDHRQELKDYYSVYNANIFNLLGLSDYSKVSISQYGPFIEYIYENQEIFKQTDYKILKDTDFGIYLTISVEEELIGSDC